MLELWGNAGIVAKAGMAVAVGTVAVAAAYAIRPTEGRLALMRPLSLATVFAAACTFFAGMAAICNGIANTSGPIGWNRVAAGAAETMAPVFAAFASLTIAWVLVAVGLRRHP